MTRPLQGPLLDRLAHRTHDVLQRWIRSRGPGWNEARGRVWILNLPPMALLVGLRAQGERTTA